MVVDSLHLESPKQKGLVCLNLGFFIYSHLGQVLQWPEFDAVDITLTRTALSAFFNTFILFIPSTPPSEPQS